MARLRNVARQLAQREVEGGREFDARYAKQRLRCLDLGQCKTVHSAQLGGVTWLDLDPVEKRFLLASASDSSVAAYDMLLPGPPADDAAAAASGSQEHRAAFKLDRSRCPDMHRYAVSCCAWYPVDTGLFVTGGADSRVKVWDTNAQQQVAEFSFQDKVHCVAMSPVAAAHCLVAVGSGEPEVRLVDPAGGGFTHSLSGHRDAVWAAAWSLTCEFQLLTGSTDGQVRLWDIRHAGVVDVFDQNSTAASSLPAAAAAAAAGGGGAGGTRSGSRAGRPNSREASGGNRAGGASAILGGRPPGGLGRAGQGAAGPSSSSSSPHQLSRSRLQATAHSGFVTAVHPTSNGLYWVTAGTDSRVRLWDTAQHRNQLVNYPGTFNSAMKPRQIATSGDGSLLFHPSGSVVQVFDLATGQLVKVLRGAHFETINALAFNPALQELYSGGNDCNIAVWAAPGHEANGDASDDADNWSQ